MLGDKLVGGGERGREVSGLEEGAGEGAEGMTEGEVERRVG